MSYDALEILRQLSFVSSVVAGFAITVAISLLTSDLRGRLVSSAIALFLSSSVITTVMTFMFVAIMAAALGPDGSVRPSERWMGYFVGGAGVLPAIGFILFLAGITLVGWLRSKAVGIITTAAVMLAFVLLFYLLRSMTGAA